MSLRRLTVPILFALMAASAYDLLWVVFFGGLNTTLVGIPIRSTTVEFPAIVLMASGGLLFIARGLYKEFLLVCGALVMAGLTGEVCLRIIDHPLSRPYIDYVAWYEPSNLYGHQLVPGFEGFGPLNIPVKVSAQGFRDQEHSIEKRGDAIRVLALGDSFLFGWGVSQEEAFLKRLEELLERATGKSIETINSGVPGWGLNQYYLYLKTVGIHYAPDVIILAYFADDLPGEIREAIPPSEQFRSGLQYKGGVLHRLRLFNFTKSLSDRIRDKNRVNRTEYLYNLDARRAVWLKREELLLSESVRGKGNLYENLLSEYLERVQRIAQSHAAVLFVMYIPDIAQLYHPEIQYVNKVLADHTTRRGIPFIDMTPVFERDQSLGAYYLHPKDAHTNAAGHLEMAKALKNLICRPPGVRGITCDGMRTNGRAAATEPQ